MARKKTDIGGPFPPEDFDPNEPEIEEAEVLEPDDDDVIFADVFVEEEGEVIELSEEAIEAEEVPEGESSTVNLEEEGEVPGLSSTTGESSLDWGDLAEEEETPTGEAATFDSPSDAALLEHAEQAIEDSGERDQGDAEEILDIDFLEKDDASEVQLGEEATGGSDERSSSRDLIAEDLESGVGIGQPGSAPGSDSYDELLLGEENAPSEDDSSAVNLDFVKDVDPLEDSAQMEVEDMDLVSFEKEAKEGAGLDDTGEGEALVDPFVSEGSDEVDLGGDDLIGSTEGTLEDDAVDALLEDEVEVEGSQEETVAEEMDFSDEEKPARKGRSKRTADDELFDETLSPESDRASGVLDVDVEVEPEPELEPAGVAEAPSKKKKKGIKEPRPKYGLRWVGGMLVGSAVCLGLWTFGLQPPTDWREKIPEDWRLAKHDQKANGNGSNIGNGNNNGGGSRPLTKEEAREQATSGDLTKPVPMNILDPDDPVDNVALGRREWDSILFSEGKDFNPKDPQVAGRIAGAEASLEKAKNGTDPSAKADAFFWLGHIKEMTGALTEAEQLYRQGQQQFPQDPRFEAALNRLELRKASTPTPTTKANPNGSHFRLMLALMMVGVQPPVGPGGQPPVGPGGQPPVGPGGQPPVGPGGQPPDGPGAAPEVEAGGLFWKAMKLAKEKKYAEARAALKEAKERHDARRFSRLRKSQNPTTDPTEEIFLRAAEGLSKLWEMEEKLNGGGYLMAEKDPAKAVEKALTDLGAQSKLAKMQGEMITTLQGDLKKAMTMVTDLKTDLAKSEDNLKDAKATIVKREMTILSQAQDLKKANDALTLSKAAVVKLTADKKDLEGAIGTVEKKLEDAKYLEVKGDRKEMFAKLDKVIDVALTKDPARRIMISEMEIQKLNNTLAKRWKPEQMLGYWIPILSDRTEKDLIEPAMEDVKRFQAEPDTGSLGKAQAAALTGLAKRNQGDYAAAKKELMASLAVDAPNTGGWKDPVQTALKELTDPEARYLSLARQWYQSRKYGEAIALLEEGLKVFADNQGAILALRSLIRLDQAKENAKGAVTLATEGMAEAKADAEAAVTSGAGGAGLYAAGQVAESVGQWGAAVDFYQKAIAAYPAEDAVKTQYKLALARALIKMADGPKAEAALPQKQKWLALLQLKRAPSVKELMALMTVALADVPPLVDPSIEKAMKIADEILAQPDIDQKPLLKAKALMIKGLSTKALKSYLNGLQPHVSRDLLDGLRDIVDNHPRLQRPDTRRVPSPFEAKKFYSAGLKYYFAGRYALAEKEFVQAIENFKQDARYFYFLGLSRLNQGKRQAAMEDFDEGADLEANGRPFSADVNASLERIQGRSRYLLNEIRDRRIR